MASIINAGTTSNTALNMSADTSGTLDLQSNGTTMASVTSTGFNIGGVVASGFTMKNRIINGDMVIDQRNNGASVTVASSGQFAVDRTQSVATVSSKFSMQRNAGSVTPPAGFTNYLGATSLSAYSLTSVDAFGLRQIIEGFNVADLGWGTANARTITISFWARSSLTGTFGLGLGNDGFSRAYAASYTINSANTWEYKTITIPGDTSGTWLTNNGVGLIVTFNLGYGSSYLGAAGVWNAGSYFMPTGATSVVSTNGATLYITGVQLERGSQATSFEWLPYGTELALCQRYCFRMSTTGNFGPYGMGHGVNSTTFRTFIKTAQTMRAQPTLSFSTASGFQWSFGNALSAISAADYGLDGFSIDCTSTGIAANGGYLLTSANNTTSSITASAEL